MKDSRNSHLILGEGNGNIFMMFTFTQSEYSQRDFKQAPVFRFLCTFVLLLFLNSYSVLLMNEKIYYHPLRSVKSSTELL